MKRSWLIGFCAAEAAFGFVGLGVTCCLGWFPEIFVCWGGWIGWGEFFCLGFLGLL